MTFSRSRQLIGAKTLGRRLALGFLDRRQLPHGEFRTLSSPNVDMRTGLRRHSSPFVTAFVVHTLSLINEPRARAMIRKACLFMISGWDSPGVWRYFSPRQLKGINSEELSRLPDFDPDLDTTACVADALRRSGYPSGCGPSIFYSCRDGRGAFRTWRRTGYAENHVDAVVNANVLLFLGHDGAKDAACDYLNEVVEGGGEMQAMVYYRDPLILYYAMSRAYRNGIIGLKPSVRTIRSRIHARLRIASTPKDALACALAACALMNLEETDSEHLRIALNCVSRLQAKDGGWQTLAFFSGNPGENRRWCGSRELTTAICLEAMVRAGGLRSRGIER